MMKSAGLADITQARVTGGGAKSALWRQILADVLGVELVTVSSEEGAAYGAALLAATGTGHFPNVETACKETVQISGTTSPGDDFQAYEAIYPAYRQLYPALQPSFNQIAELEA